MFVEVAFDHTVHGLLLRDAIIVLCMSTVAIMVEFKMNRL